MFVLAFFEGFGMCRIGVRDRGVEKQTVRLA